jgi:hypothetical protein
MTVEEKAWAAWDSFRARYNRTFEIASTKLGADGSAGSTGIPLQRLLSVTQRCAAWISSLVGSQALSGDLPDSEEWSSRFLSEGDEPAVIISTVFSAMALLDCANSMNNGDVDTVSRIFDDMTVTGGQPDMSGNMFSRPVGKMPTTHSPSTEKTKKSGRKKRPKKSSRKAGGSKHGSGKKKSGPKRKSKGRKPTGKR